MTRFLVAALAVSFAALFVAPAFADTPDLKTQSGQSMFWMAQANGK